MTEPTGEGLPPRGAWRRGFECWALVGGWLLIFIVLLTAGSQGSGLLLGRPLPGDFELVEVGVAVAVFTFLPYCEITGANVTADFFTARAGPRILAALRGLAALLAVTFALLLMHRMTAGLIDYQRTGEITAIIGFPKWLAFIPILISLILLVAAAAINLRRATVDFRTPPPII